MDIEEQLWLGLAIITAAIFAFMIGYSVFVAAPHHHTQISLCEQAGGVAVTDDGRFRLCLSADAVIKLEELNDAD